MDIPLVHLKMGPVSQKEREVSEHSALGYNLNLSTTKCSWTSGDWNGIHAFTNTPWMPPLSTVPLQWFSDGRSQTWLPFATSWVPGSGARTLGSQVSPDHPQETLVLTWGSLSICRPELYFQPWRGTWPGIRENSSHHFPHLREPCTLGIISLVITCLTGR